MSNVFDAEKEQQAKDWCDLTSFPDWMLRYKDGSPNFQHILTTKFFTYTSCYKLNPLPKFRNEYYIKRKKDDQYMREWQRCQERYSQPRKTTSPPSTHPVESLSCLDPQTIPPYLTQANHASSSTQRINWQRYVHDQFPIDDIISNKDKHDLTVQLDASSKIGQGSFSWIYKGKLNQEEVAIKCAVNNSDEGLVLWKEIAILMSLKRRSAGRLHNNVIDCHGYGLLSDQNEVFYAMELGPMKDLYYMLYLDTNDVTECRLACGNVKLDLLRSIACGLQHLHLHGIVHGDIKSKNIILDHDWNAKLIDLSSAVFIDCSQMESAGGSAGYVPPEVYFAAANYQEHAFYCPPLSKQSDIYSFGILAIELLSEEVPYYDRLHWVHSSEDYFDNLMKNGLHVDIPQSLPPALISILERMFQSEPSLRPTIEEILAVLYEIEIIESLY